MLISVQTYLQKSVHNFKFVEKFSTFHCQMYSFDIGSCWLREMSDIITNKKKSICKFVYTFTHN